MSQPKNKQRRRKGFERTSSLLSTRIRKTGEARGFAVTRVLTHWAEIVGEDIAAIAKPVEVSYARGGMGATLTVLTTGAQAPMLEMQKEQLREKVNAVYGYNAIARVRITQTAPTGFSEGQAQFTPAPKKAPVIDETTCTRAAEVTEDVTDAGLREALETLARNVLMKQKHDRG
ncbi:hypothetical protein SAMN05444851_0226 [Aliiroseovarius sediminilitoris]|uniref:RNA-binding protein n=1 Tax=Aliiroseovarius sediminilitoris TaxID=1173584 RepID=A0A1I0MPP7_9RHOB|nr:DciA family protein [Aliiroseovarius sediminilitoris]SEV90495.1 hypothetical protein SAMN05444851_0226 [Aliiroseovarius sediminilitoris]